MVEGAGQREREPCSKSLWEVDRDSLGEKLVSRSPGCPQLGEPLPFLKGKGVLGPRSVHSAAASYLMSTERALCTRCRAKRVTHICSMNTRHESVRHAIFLISQVKKLRCREGQ